MKIERERGDELTGICSISLEKSTISNRKKFKKLYSFVSKRSLVGLHDSDNHSKKSDGRSKDFNDENFDEQSWVGGISDGSSGSDDADGETTDEVRETDGESSSENHISSGQVTCKNSHSTFVLSKILTAELL